MTDIRERHVRSASRPNYCAQDGDWWGENGCDAYIALAMLDKAEAALAKYRSRAESWEHMSEREAQAIQRADKAEAALASLLANGPEERIWLEYKHERDAARADAKALAEAGSHSVYCATPFALYASGDCTCGWSAALAAHEEATKA